MIIIVFLSSFLIFSCAKDVDKRKLVYYSQRPSTSLLYDGKKELEIVLELREDTVFVKKNIPPSGNNSLEYFKLTVEENERLKKILSGIEEIQIKPEYISKGDYEYEYMLKVGDFTTLIYTEEYPQKLERLILFLKKIIIKGTYFKSIEISEDYKDLSIRGIASDAEDVNSEINNYILWKGLVLENKKEVLKKEKLKFIYRVDYPPYYNGNRITNLMSDDLKIFFYELDGKTYCFELDTPLLR